MCLLCDRHIFGHSDTGVTTLRILTVSWAVDVKLLDGLLNYKHTECKEDHFRLMRTNVQTEQ